MSVGTRRPIARDSIVLLQAMITPSGRIAWEALPTTQIPMPPQGWGELLGKIGRSILDYQKHERPYLAAEQMLDGFVRGFQTEPPRIPSGSA